MLITIELLAMCRSTQILSLDYNQVINQTLSEHIYIPLPKALRQKVSELDEPISFRPWRPRKDMCHVHRENSPVTANDIRYRSSLSAIRKHLSQVMGRFFNNTGRTILRVCSDTGVIRGCPLENTIRTLGHSMKRWSIRTGQLTFRVFLAGNILTQNYPYAPTQISLVLRYTYQGIPSESQSC